MKCNSVSLQVKLQTISCILGYVIQKSTHFLMLKKRCINQGEGLINSAAKYHVNTSYTVPISIIHYLNLPPSSRLRATSSSSSKPGWAPFPVWAMRFLFAEGKEKHVNAIFLRSSVNFLVITLCHNQLN